MSDLLLSLEKRNFLFNKFNAERHDLNGKVVEKEKIWKKWTS